MAPIPELIANHPHAIGQVLHAHMATMAKLHAYKCTMTQPDARAMMVKLTITEALHRMSDAGEGFADLLDLLQREGL